MEWVGLQQGTYYCTWEGSIHYISHAPCKTTINGEHVCKINVDVHVLVKLGVHLVGPKCIYLIKPEGHRSHSLTKFNGESPIHNVWVLN